jgi:hypothetical protein
MVLARLPNIHLLVLRGIRSSSFSPITLIIALPVPMPVAVVILVSISSIPPPALAHAHVQSLTVVARVRARLHRSGCALDDALMEIWTGRATFCRRGAETWLVDDGLLP